MIWMLRIDCWHSTLVSRKKWVLDEKQSQFVYRRKVCILFVSKCNHPIYDAKATYITRWIVQNRLKQQQWLYVQFDYLVSMASPACHFPPELSVSCHKPLRWPEPLCSAVCSAPPGFAHTPAWKRSPALAGQWMLAQQPCARTRCGGGRGCSCRPHDTGQRDSWAGLPPVSRPASPRRASAKAERDAGAEESGIQSLSGGGSSQGLDSAPS